MEKCAVLLHGTFFNEFPFGKHVPLHNLLFFSQVRYLYPGYVPPNSMYNYTLKFYTLFYKIVTKSVPIFLGVFSFYAIFYTFYSVLISLHTLFGKYNFVFNANLRFFSLL